MTLEVLFARAEQGQTFLRLVVCGLAAGALLQACLALGRKWPRLCVLWDILAVSAVMLLVLPVLLLSGEGVRAYGLLGLIVGAALYAAGLRYAAASAAGWIKKHHKSATQKQEEAGRTGNK